jgi:hypothetical protein
MKLGTAVWLFGSLVLARSGAGEPHVPIAHDPDEAPDPYAVISERNIFHLNPMPPEPSPEPPKVELPVIKYYGFFKVGHVTKALFCSLPKDKKEEPTYYNLAEGEKAGFLELVKIRFDKGEVDVVNSGTAMTLSLKEDSQDGKPERSTKERDGHPMHEKTFHNPGQPLGGPHGFSEGGGAMPPGLPGRPRRSPVPP